MIADMIFSEKRVCGGGKTIFFISGVGKPIKISLTQVLGIQFIKISKTNSPLLTHILLTRRRGKRRETMDTILGMVSFPFGGNHEWIGT
jgi:hypothetical protein